MLMLFAIMSAIFSIIHPLTFTINGGSEICFFEELEKDQRLKGGIQVVKGGDRKLTLNVCHLLIPHTPMPIFLRF
jgi:hypothetical protein